MSESPRSPGRRNLLIASGTLVTAAAGGAAWVGSRLDGNEAWIEATVRKHLPGVELDPESLQAFVKRFASSRHFREREQSIAILIDQGSSAVARRITKANRRLERLERLVVSEYLSGSNFFYVADPRQETIFHTGPMPACGNPFAVFRDA